MVVIRQRNDPVRLFWRRLFMLGLGIFVLFGLWAVIGVYAKDRESGTLRAQAEAQLQDLEKREAALNARISALETERGQEAAIRSAYEVGRDGEGMVVIVDKPATASPEKEPELNWFQRLFQW
jgi:cell division protein FtsB